MSSTYLLPSNTQHTPANRGGVGNHTGIQAYMPRVNNAQRPASPTTTENAVKPASTSVSLSKAGQELALKDLQDHVSQLGNQTVAFAQDFVQQFAQQTLGLDAKDLKIQFNAASVSAESKVEISQAQASDGKQTISQSSASISDSSSFTGKGTITTKDGRKFDFEVGVQYEASVETASQTQQSTSATSSPSNAKLLMHQQSLHQSMRPQRTTF